MLGFLSNDLFFIININVFIAGGAFIDNAKITHNIINMAQNEKTLPDAIKEVKQKELQDMQGRIQEFQQSAQENIRKRESELLKPIIEKAKTAIAAVAKEGAYSYVFDSSAAGFLYKPDGDNMLAKVKTKLGIL